MTWPAALTASCVRSLAVMLVGVVMARWLVEWHRSTTSVWLRRVQLIGLSAVFLTPNLIVGFGYRAISINLLNQRWLNELLYFALILFETVPAAFWLMLVSPPPSLSAEAWHASRLLRGHRRAVSTWRQRAAFWWRGAGETLIGPAALLFVLSFQESELAALMQVAGWPERLFTDHVKGVPPARTLGLVAWPMLIQVPFMIPLLARLRTALLQTSLSVLAEKRPRSTPTWIRSLVGAVWIAASLGFVIGEPAWHLIDGVLRAGGTVSLQPRWRQELWDAVLLAATAVGLTWTAVEICAAICGRSRFAGASFRSSSWLLAISLLPGLTGTLALGLLTAGFFQRFAPRWAYTPLPLILAEFLWLWPRVILVQQSIAARTRVAAMQLTLLARSPDPAQRARASVLWWQVTGRPMAGGLLLIGWWAYLEVMLPTILAMPGFMPAPMVMYNHLHYGQLEALGVKLAMILVVPGLLGSAVWGTVRFLTGRRTP